MSQQEQRIPLKGGDEQDALTGWRRFYASFKRAGYARQSKKSYRKRIRAEHKRDLQRIRDGQT